MMSFVFMYSCVEYDIAQIELNVGVPDGDPNFDLRYNALFLVGFHPSRVFKIVHTELPFKARTVQVFSSTVHGGVYSLFDASHSCTIDRP